MARRRFMVRSMTSVRVSARLNLVFSLPELRHAVPSMLPQQNMLHFLHQHSLVTFPSVFFLFQLSQSWFGTCHVVWFCLPAALASLGSGTDVSQQHCWMKPPKLECFAKAQVRKNGAGCGQSRS